MWLFMSACSLFTRLYEVMTAHGFASRTAISNGLRYSSRNGLSWTRESMVNRWVSCSLPTKSTRLVSEHGVHTGFLDGTNA